MAGAIGMVSRLVPLVVVAATVAVFMAGRLSRDVEVRGMPKAGSGESSAMLEHAGGLADLVQRAPRDGGTLVGTPDATSTGRCPPCPLLGPAGPRSKQPPNGDLSAELDKCRQTVADLQAELQALQAQHAAQKSAESDRAVRPFGGAQVAGNIAKPRGPFDGLHQVASKEVFERFLRYLPDTAQPPARAFAAAGGASSGARVNHQASRNARATTDPSSPLSTSLVLTRNLRTKIGEHSSGSGSHQTSLWSLNITDTNTLPLSSALDSCKEVDFVIMDRDPSKCLALVEADRIQSFHLTRFRRVIDGFMDDVDVTKLGHGAAFVAAADDEANEIRVGDGQRPSGWHMVSRVYQSGAYKGVWNKAPNRQQNILADRLLGDFLVESKTILRDLEGTVKRLTADPKFQNTVIAVAVNYGELDILTNMICSARANQVDIGNLLVFAADQKTADAVTALGHAAYHNPALGRYPEDASNVFGDMTFVKVGYHQGQGGGGGWDINSISPFCPGLPCFCAKMMFIKALSIYLPAQLHVNCLFTDVDVLVLRDFLPVFFDADHNGFDVVVSDDGARNVRFGPFMTNSGFYFVRSGSPVEAVSARIIAFLREIVFSYALNLNWSSHQAVLSMRLADLHSLLGITVKVLPMETFASGMLWTKTHYMQRLRTGEVAPFIWHMCKFPPCAVLRDGINRGSQNA